MTTNELTFTLPTLAGFTFRMFESDGDYVHIARITSAMSDADHLDFFPTAEWLKNFLESLPNTGLRRDMLIAEDATTGEPVAYGRVSRFEQADGTRRYDVTVRVHPNWRRRRVGITMSRWLEAHGRELNATLAPNANTVFETWADETQTGNVALLTREGYVPLRYGYEMTRALDDVTPIPDFALPAGFEVRSAKPEHYRAVWDADVEAFRDHNGFSEPSEARYEAWLKDPLGFQPDLWQVAWDVEKNEVAGMVQNFINHDDNKKLNRQRGYTEGISTRRPYRKLGLARALICISLRMFKGMGMTEAALGVDATNPTGALRVYEDCGFKPIKTEIVYQKKMTMDPSSGSGQAGR